MLFATAACCVLAVRPAHADVTDTVNFSLNGAPNATTISLPQFNPADGTLNSAMINVNGAVTFAIEIFNTGPGAFSVTALDTVTFGGIPIPVEGTFASTIPANQPEYVFTSPGVSFGPLTESIGQAADSSFVGTGTVPFDLFLANPSLDQFSGATAYSALAFSGVTGTVSIDYAFTAAASSVPEPGSVALTGFALILAGTLARRKLFLRSVDAVDTSPEQLRSATHAENRTANEEKCAQKGARGFGSN